MEKPQFTNRSRWSRFVGPAVILLAAAVAVAPQLVHGNSCGHDFDFHLVSWFDCLNSWRHGIAYPHWAASANYGAGEPRFVFYSPLTWMLGAALGAALPWTLVPMALIFLLLAGTGLATRALARQALSEGAATLAGCVALFSGYALFTAYERTAFAELAGGLWIPLVLLFALRERKASVDSLKPLQGCGKEGQLTRAAFLARKSRPAESSRCCANPENILRRALDGSAVGLALAIAGAWLSNPTVGVMACYLLAAVALTRALLALDWAPVLRSAVGAGLGIGLVALYLVPAAWEQRWVDIHQVTEDSGQTLENNWLFAVHADPALALHDAVLHTVSMIAVLMIAAALAGLLACWLRGRLPGGRRWWIPLALIPVTVLFLQFPASHWLWNRLPELRFLQFPWRWLLVVEAPMAVFLAAAVWPRDAARPWRRVAVGLVCGATFLAMTCYAARHLYQNCYDEDSVPSMLSEYGSGQGFIGTFEYEPVGADNALVAMRLPDACLVSDAATVLGVSSVNQDTDETELVWQAGQGSCAAAMSWQPGGPEHKRLRAIVSRSGYLVLRLRSYPAWRVRVNGRAVGRLPQREDGLMAVPVAQGSVDLAVDWVTTPDVIAGRWLTALAALLLVGLWLLERRLEKL
jgi:hypothetical protein